MQLRKEEGGMKSANPKAKGAHKKSFLSPFFA
jgi:hypothetical protein